eukprot:gene12945-13073_t
MLIANKLARPQGSRARIQGSRGRHGPVAAVGPRVLPGHQALQHVRAVSNEHLEYWDVVEYQQDLNGKQQQQLRVGLVQQVNPDGVVLCPLIEEDDGVWMADEEVAEQQVPFNSVIRVLDHTFGQRQDKENNPHGEHAHDVWQLLAPVSQSVYRGSSR